MAIAVRLLNYLFLKKGIFYATLFCLLETLLLTDTRQIERPCGDAVYYRDGCDLPPGNVTVKGCLDFSFICEHKSLEMEYGCHESCAKYCVDWSHCETLDFTEGLITWSLILFDILTAVYLFMVDHDVVKSNLPRSALYSMVTVLLTHSDDEENSPHAASPSLSDDEFEMSEMSQNSGRDGSNREGLFEIVPSEILKEGVDEELCAWNFEDLTFIVSAIFANVSAIIYVVASSRTAPPLCFSSERVSGSGIAGFVVFGALFVVYVLVIGGALVLKCSVDKPHGEKLGVDCPSRISWHSHGVHCGCGGRHIWKNFPFIVKSLEICFPSINKRSAKKIDFH
jgi:hypothetical protein